MYLCVESAGEAHRREVSGCSGAAMLGTWPCQPPTAASEGCGISSLSEAVRRRGRRSDTPERECRWGIEGAEYESDGIRGIRDEWEVLCDGQNLVF